MASEEKTEPVLVTEQRGAVKILRLNRPEARNALNPELLDAIGLSMVAAENDPDTRAIVLTGTGDRAFCAGMDLRAFAEGGTVSASKEGMAGFARFTGGEISVPIVGAANATAVAGGFELLLGCDVVVAAENALFGVPEVKRGLFAAGGGVFISTRIPLAAALELTLTGDLIDAVRAQALGLINQAVPAGGGARRRGRPGRAHRQEWPARPGRHQADGAHGLDRPEAGAGAGEGMAAQGLQLGGRQGRGQGVHREA